MVSPGLTLSALQDLMRFLILIALGVLQSFHVRFGIIVQAIHMLMIALGCVLGVAVRRYERQK